MSQVEDGDLDIRVSMALVVTGKYRDLMEIRRLVREKIARSAAARFIHGTIYVANANTGEYKRLLGDGRGPCRSPDGTEIAFVAYSSIWVMDAADGANRRQLSDPPERYEDEDPNWSPDGTTAQVWAALATLAASRSHRPTFL